MHNLLELTESRNTNCRGAWQRGIALCAGSHFQAESDILVTTANAIMIKWEQRLILLHCVTLP